MRNEISLATLSNLDAPLKSGDVTGVYNYLKTRGYRSRYAREQGYHCQPFYTARIDLSPAALRNANGHFEKAVVLGPGLRAEVFIQTYARSALHYLPEPMKDGIRTSVRD
ncbi:hypothetical protein OKW50_006514 [Paraburkholderia youngii]|uniref:Uncharacterized protein n=1 Tax=Paraburkholderia youngii TaxID=2782701 RepID=A0ABX2NJW4_9BURK|nr:hypothetical protein [Paraburkholderia youngii]NUX56278.1 hypothetical protein [Paraburkholderia youngii]NVI04533.1 hypothetical protein [Paraburkholderia youngii]